jgi:hypothetical protein
MNMLQLPFFTELESAKRILIAGAGGGYDVFSGLPLYFGLRAAGKSVYLANLSFSFLASLKTKRLSPSVVEVDADTPRGQDYFPELFLSQWFRAQGDDVSIYCFSRTGYQPLSAAYQALVKYLAVDTVILVDGGTDSLMRGDEIGLGTPQEDIASLLAVDALDVERKLLTCLGFGVDKFHGVCHYYFLEAVAELGRTGGYLGMFSLLPEMPEVRQYRAASEAVFREMDWHVSIVGSSVLAALAGHYGDYQATERTKGSELWINPLMPVYWCFRVGAVAARVLYKDIVQTTTTYFELDEAINHFRATNQPARPWKSIPV